MLNPVTPALEAALRAHLPARAFREAGPAYLEEPRGRFHGKAGLVVAPGSTAEVAQTVRLCAEARVGIVPFGGGTGLVGGQIAPDLAAPLVLSLERMAALRAVYPEENVLIAEAGMILADVQSAAEAAGRLFGLSIASQGSARIGGVLAANAGGVGVLRYGNARDLCLGVEAVLADGSILHGLKRLRKDNTGYDLRHLLIGAEGTLGIITAAALKLHPRPARHGTALLVVPDPAAALGLLARAQAMAGESLSAFELISRTGLAFLAQAMPDLRQPFPTPPEWCVLIELGTAAHLDPAALLGALFEAAAGEGQVLDGVIAASEAQRAALWQLRENLPEANRHIGAISSHDISLPLGALPAFIARAGAALAGLGAFRINCFGHVGDGNLHYNVFPATGSGRDATPEERAAVTRCVHDLVHALGGSVSAEHGIGRLKVGDLERYADPTKLAAMRALKAALDPAGILNPGAVLRLPDQPVAAGADAGGIE